MESRRPKGLPYYLSWIPRDELNQEIDYKHRDHLGRIVNRDLGSIAENMPDWIGNIAENALRLPQAEITAIQRGQYQGNLTMQKREALLKWKSTLGVSATPRALITAFFDANEIPCVEAACRVLGTEPTKSPTTKEKDHEHGSMNNVEVPHDPVMNSKTGPGVEDGTDSIDSPEGTAPSTEGDSFKWCSFTREQIPTTRSLPPIEGAYSAALPRGVVLWRKKEITVSFTNKSVPLLTTWNRKRKDILAFANKWQAGKPNHVPKFVDATEDASGRNKSLPGNAKKAGSDKPTMWLDLSSNNSNYNEYLVVHEFGHALGLGHEHQRSDFRECVIPFLDEAKMRQCVTDERFKDWEVDAELDLETATEYDSKSVMHYWFEKSWLKFGYDNKKKIEDNFKAGILSEKMKNALEGIHSCSAALPSMPTEPSPKDLEFINGVYEKIGKPGQ